MALCVGTRRLGNRFRCLELGLARGNPAAQGHRDAVFFCVKRAKRGGAEQNFALSKKIPADRPCESAGKFFFWLLFFERKEK